MAKVKIPKRVVGVKIPKKVRKRARKAIKMAESPLVREAAVAALGAAGIGKVAKDAANGNGRSKGPRRIDADTLMEAIREAALDGVRRFLEGLEEGLRNATDAAAEAAEAVDDKSGDGRGKRKRDKAKDEEPGRRSADAN